MYSAFKVEPLHKCSYKIHQK